MVKGDSQITLPTYEKHWIHTKEYGHDIVIWTQNGKMTIKCIFADRTRNWDGKVKGKFDEDKD